MAIHPSLPGFQVNICPIDVGNKPLLGVPEPLKEYQIEGPYTPKSGNRKSAVTRYVESVTNQQFGISFRLPDDSKQMPDKHFVAKVWIDGLQQSKMYYNPKPGATGPHALMSTGSATDVQSNPDKLTVRPWTFTEIETFMYGDTSMTLNHDVGTIVVEIYLPRKLDVKKPVTQPLNKKPNKPKAVVPDKVHEKSMKTETKTHKVSLGEEKIDTTNRRATLTTALKSPVATFIFKYRSTDVVEMLLAGADVRNGVTATTNRNMLVTRLTQLKSKVRVGFEQLLGVLSTRKTQSRLPDEKYDKDWSKDHEHVC